MKTTENKPVIIAEGKLVLSGSKFQYILQDGVKRLVWGKDCIKIILLFMVIGLSSCLNSAMDDDYQKIDPRIKPYVDSFVKEASVRKVNIDITYLKIVFGDLKGEAEGRSWMDGTHLIVIDSTLVEWKGSPEQLVFHELGHMCLYREHDDSRIGNYPKSIMAGWDSPFWENAKYHNRRQYYVDELFNPNTERPEWSYL
jgi:hypothetical protein